MSQETLTRLTPEAYLKLERASQERHEYRQGEIVAVEGSSREHSLIKTNLAAELSQALKGKPYEVYSSTMRVRVPKQDAYLYSDVVVVSGEPQLEDTHLDTLLNPVLITEVLSDSTEAYDRGQKFALYRSIPTLQEYLLVSQNEYLLEHYLRQEEGRWLLTEVKGLEASLTLTHVPCTLALSEVYERVKLEENLLP